MRKLYTNKGEKTTDKGKAPHVGLLSDTSQFGNSQLDTNFEVAAPIYQSLE